MARSPTSLKVPTSGECEDVDMETEEEDDLRAKGLNDTKRQDGISIVCKDNCSLSFPVI